MRPLGKNQISVLRALVIYGDYSNHFSCGWTWNNNSGTVRIMKSLMKRLMVSEFNGNYSITQLGKDTIKI